MKLSKAAGRREARIRAWDTADASYRARTGRSLGKRPGSNKKPFPAGRGKSHKKVA